MFLSCLKLPTIIHFTFIEHILDTRLYAGHFVFLTEASVPRWVGRATIPAHGGGSGEDTHASGGGAWAQGWLSCNHFVTTEFHLWPGKKYLINKFKHR